MKTLRIISVIALLSLCFSAKAQSFRTSDITMEPNESRSIVLYLDNANNCVATGFKIAYPSGFADETSFSIADEQTNKHYIEYRRSNGQCLLYSPENKPFIKSSNGFLWVGIEAPSIAGKYTIYLKDIEFATNDLKLVTQSDLAINVTVQSADGIDAVDADSTGNDAIYSLDGVKRKEVSTGVNIIRSSDGKAKKVMVK